MTYILLKILILINMTGKIQLLQVIFYMDRFHLKNIFINKWDELNDLRSYF